MRRFVILGFLVILSVGGCTSMKTASTGSRPDAAPVSAPPVPPAAPTNVSATPSNSGTGQSAPPPTPPVSAASRDAAPRTARVPTRSAPAAPRPAAAPPRPAIVPSATPPPASKPTLNLADLEQRLRDTHAIGLFAKLSLKNQVDDLLNAFRALYRDPSKRPPPELRQRYDQLLLKLLSLLQDSDPPLATAIASSREAIWSILADPDKFSKI